MYLETPSSSTVTQFQSYFDISGYTVQSHREEVETGASTCEFWGDTIQPIAIMFKTLKHLKKIKIETFAKTLMFVSKWQRI